MMSKLKWNMQYLFLFLLMLPALVRAQEYTVRGEVKSDKGKVLLVTQRVSGPDTLAEATFSGGKFILRGTLEEAVAAVLRVEGYPQGFVIMLEPGVEVTAVLTEDGQGNIRGGRLQELFREYQRIVVKTNAEMGVIRKKLDKAMAAGHYRTGKELRMELQKTQQSGKNKLRTFIDEDPDNVFAAYVLTSGLEQELHPDTLAKVYASLSEKAKTTEPGKILAARIASLKRVQVAAIAPDFTLPTPDGKEISLYGLKGKLKIVDFWASWCGPCRLENPNMVSLYRDFKDKGLVVISISLDQQKAPWVKAVEKDGMGWIQVSSLKGWECEVVKRYHVDAVPFILVLDENNRILAKQLRAEKLRALVTKYLR